MKETGGGAGRGLAGVGGRLGRMRGNDTDTMEERYRNTTLAGWWFDFFFDKK